MVVGQTTNLSGLNINQADLNFKYVTSYDCFWNCLGISLHKKYDQLKVEV